jgi:predicted lipoprotein with Yx(FWY)xxD motif
MLHRTRAIPAIAIMAALALGLAACGGSSSNNDPNTTAAAATHAASAGGQTVATKSIAGTGTVLVNSSGMALYTNNTDSGSKVACTTSCTAIWVPLAAPSGGQPTAADSAVQAKLGTIKRSDGSMQVTFDGKPLYSFVQDSPGQVTGNGASDQFNGTQFTWTAATVGGGGSGSSAATTSSSSGGSAYGGGGSGGGGSAYGGGGY